MTLRRKLLLSFLVLAVLPIGLMAALVSAGAFAIAKHRGEQDLGRSLDRLAALIRTETEMERLDLTSILRGWESVVQSGIVRDLPFTFSRRQEVVTRLRQTPCVTSRYLIVPSGSDSCTAIEGFFEAFYTGIRTTRSAVSSLPPEYRGFTGSGSKRPALFRLVTVERPRGWALALLSPFGDETQGGLAVEEINVVVLMQKLLDPPASPGLETVFLVAARPGSTPVFLYHSDPTLIGLDIAQAGWSPHLSRRLNTQASSDLGSLGHRRSTGSNAAPRWSFTRDGDRLYAAGLSSPTGWLLGGSISLEPAFASLRSGLDLAFVLLAVMAILVTCAILLVTRGVGRAVETIAAGAATIARGDFEHTIRLHRRDEFGAIADHLNQMARELVITAESRSIARLGVRITHDLKGVASQMNLLLHNLERNYDDPEFRAEYVALTQALAAQIESLVLKLRRGGPERPPYWEHFELDPFIAELIERLTTGREPGVTVRCELVANSTIIADRELLEEGIQNVLTNALEAIGEGGSIMVRTGTSPQGSSPEDPTHWIEVADTGRGMTADFIEHDLFRPFVTTKDKGLGLGMYQARQAITRQGGSLEVSSREGSGTRVRIKVGKRSDGIGGQPRMRP